MRTSALLTVPLCLATVVGCSGKSAAAKTAEAAAQAKSACEVFHNFHPPAGSAATSQVDYAKASYGAFLRAADLAGQAADEDARWKSLSSAATREAAAFGVIVHAAEGTTTLNADSVNAAVSDAKAARSLFLSACVQADPTVFTSH